jgi:CubicO group peptidase (beta-lactamase class C family)
LYHLRNVYHGYLWWGIDYPYKDRVVHAFFAGGAGGQVVMVIRELDLVVAIYAGNYSSMGTIHISHELIPSYILTPPLAPRARLVSCVRCSLGRQCGAPDCESVARV